MVGDATRTSPGTGAPAPARAGTVQKCPSSRFSLTGDRVVYGTHVASDDPLRPADEEKKYLGGVGGTRPERHNTTGAHIDGDD